MTARRAGRGEVNLFQGFIQKFNLFFFLPNWESGRSHDAWGGIISNGLIRKQTLALFYWGGLRAVVGALIENLVWGGTAFKRVGFKFFFGGFLHIIAEPCFEAFGTLF